MAKIKIIYLKGMSPRSFAKLLKDINACYPAQEWCKGRSLKQAWRYTTKGNWMSWLLCNIEGHGKGYPEPGDTFDLRLRAAYKTERMQFAKAIRFKAKFFRQYVKVR